MCRDTIRAGLAQYYRMFRTELRRFGRLYQLAATISRPKVAPDGETASWTIETRADDWATRTSYDFLRFEDLIQRDLAAPIWRTVLHAMWIYWRLVFGGTIARFWKAHWRFATFISYPHFLLFNEAIWSLGIAYGFARGLGSARHSRPVQHRRRGGRIRRSPRHHPEIHREQDLSALSFVRHDMDLGILAPPAAGMGSAHRPFCPHCSPRSRAAATPRKSSSSATVPDRFWAPRFWRARSKLDPALGRHGPRVVLLTIGGNFPIVGFHAASQDFRDHLRLLAVEPSIDWIDCQSRKDVMNFYPFDPITGHGIDVGAARRNPTIVPVRFREIIKPEHYNLFRWKFFRVHFQFVMANERPHAYDFFMIVCGPVPLSERMTHPEAALAIAAADAAKRETAWKKLETASSKRGTAAELGEMEPEMEPTARRRG